VAPTMGSNSAMIYGPSDFTKAGISVVLFAYQLFLTFRDRGKVSNTAIVRIRRASLFAWPPMIIYYVGAHEPLRLGWRTYIITNSLFTVILLDILLYLALVVSRAQYRITNRSKLIPSIRPKLIATGIIILSMSFVTAVVAVLATNRIAFNVIRHFGTAVTLSLGGSYFVYTLVRLRFAILKSRKSLQMVVKPNKSDLKASEVLCTGPPTQQEDEGMKIVKDPREIIERKILRKMLVLTISCTVIAPIVITSSVFTGIIQLQQGLTYSEDNDLENDNYMPVLDFTTWLAMIVNALYMYYAYFGHRRA